MSEGVWHPNPIGTRMNEICWCDAECDQRPCVTRQAWWNLPDGAIVPDVLADAFNRAKLRAMRSLCT